MRIAYHKFFVKTFQKRIYTKKLKSIYKEKVLLFLKNRHHPILRDHKLHGSKKHLRAFSITGDIRVVYEDRGKVLYFL